MRPNLMVGSPIMVLRDMEPQPRLPKCDEIAKTTGRPFSNPVVPGETKFRVHLIGGKGLLGQCPMNNVIKRPQHKHGRHDADSETGTRNNLGF